MTAPLDEQHPLLPRRLAAMLYDLFLVLPVVMAGVALAMGLRTLLLGVPAEETGEAALNPQLVQFIATACVAAFFSIFWLRSGQTLGMQAWRIKLVTIDGGPMSLRHALLRCLAALLSAAPLGLGYLWCIVDRNKRYWHDYLSGTELILLPKVEKKKTS